MVDWLDGGTARRWVHAAETLLRDARARIDALNVYPVPDGDTGTNLHLTIAQAAADVDDLEPEAPLGEVCRVIARSALLAARGNSGIIASQLLQGWADQLHGCDKAASEDVVAALVRADREAWAAVEAPVPGTMLSVTRAAAQGAAQACDGSDVAQVLAAAVDAARTALDETPNQLPVLAEAGVVDAGGAGVVLLLDALLSAVTGEPAPDLPALGTQPDGVDAVPAVCDHLASGGPQYEVMYVLEGPAGAVPALRAELAALGDSLVVVGSDELWRVHVHVDDPGAAVEAGVRAGRPSAIRITHFGAAAGAAAAGEPRDGAARHDAVGVVAWAAGPGLAELFAGCGAVPVLPQQGRRASTSEVLDAVRRTGSGSVVVLPNDPDTLAVARAAAVTAREEGLRVTVVPTKAQVQGLAAAAVHDPEADLDQDVAAMSAAAGATRHGAVTIAARDAITMAGRCRAGDVLGVVDGDFAVIGDDLTAVACDVANRLLSGGGEIVTLVTGQDATDGLAESVRDAVRRGHPTVEVTVVAGGQPRYPLLLGVE